MSHRLCQLLVLIVIISGSSLAEAQIATNRKIEQVLKEKTTLEFEEQEFSAVINEIKDQHKINVSVHQSAKDAGLGPDDLVSINVTGVSLNTAMTLFLETYECTYIVDDEFFQIMTIDEADGRILLKSYDCRNLIKVLKKKNIETVYYNGKPTNYPVESNGKKGTKLVKVDDVAQKSDKTKTTQAKDQNYFVHEKTLEPGQHLAHVIQKMSDSKSWLSNGGKGTITEINGILFIKQTGYQHKQVKKILETLEFDLLNYKFSK